MEIPKTSPEIRNRVLKIEEILKSKTLKKFHKGRYEDLIKQYDKLEGAIAMLPMSNQNKIKKHVEEIELSIQTIELREKEQIRIEKSKLGILAYSN